MTQQQQTSHVTCIICAQPVSFRYTPNNPCKIYVQCSNCKDHLTVTYHGPGGKTWHSNAR